MALIPNEFDELGTRTEQARLMQGAITEYFGNNSLTNQVLMDMFTCENPGSLYFLLHQDVVPRTNGRPSLLTEQQTAEFVDLVTERFDQNNPLSYRDAFIILHRLNEQIDYKYVKSFIRRNNEVLEIYSSRVIERRRNNIDVNSYYSYLTSLNTSLSTANGISGNLFFNIDEIGFGDMQSLSSIKTIGPKGKSTAPDYSVPAAVKRITAVVGIFLDGGYCTLMIIIPTRTLHRNVFSELGQYRNFVLMEQENGFMTEDIFMEYLSRILFPEIERRRNTFILKQTVQ